MAYSFKTSFLGVVVYAASAVAASAQSRDGWWRWWNWREVDPGATSRVPEIDASTGLLALAAVAAGLALAYEIRRRRRKS